MNPIAHFAWVICQRIGNASLSQKPPERTPAENGISWAGVLWLYMRTAFMLWVNISLVVTATTMLATSREPTSNPFWPYIDFATLKLSLNMDALQDRGLTCYIDHLILEVMNCSIQLLNEVFDAVGARSADRIVRRISFKLDSGILTAGDLALLWGKPDIQREGQSANLLWEDINVSAVVETHNHHFTYWLPVVYINFD